MRPSNGPNTKETCLLLLVACCLLLLGRGQGYSNIYYYTPDPLKSA